jgi:hypothetical protein
MLQGEEGFIQLNGRKEEDMIYLLGYTNLSSIGQPVLAYLALGQMSMVLPEIS